MMKLLKKLIALALCAGLMLALAAPAGAISTWATSTCVMDADTGRVLYEDNAHEQRPIASITKIMTGLIACENYESVGLETVLTVSQNAFEEDGSSMYLNAGDKITLMSCIYGTMLRSGNDAAMLLAETFGGDEEGFVELMNEKAQEIGMTETLYGNPNGLVDEGNYSTAYDMCLLGCYAMNNELFAKVVSTNYIETDDGYAIENHNRLLERDSRCIGIKTGFTSAAGRTLVSCFQDPDSGQRIVICTLNDSNDFVDHVNVADWAFENYPTRTLCEAGEKVTSFAVGDVTYELTAQDTITYPLRGKDTRAVRCSMTLPANDVELTEGEPVGEAVYTLDGTEIGRTSLICQRQAEEN